jgi:hypothetical protein
MTYIETQPLYETNTFRDCVHVGYDFSQANEPDGVMDLWVRDLDPSESYCVLIRQGPRGEDYFPALVRRDTRPKDERWAVVYDLWKLRQ